MNEAAELRSELDQALRENAKLRERVQWLETTNYTKLRADYEATVLQVDALQKKLAVRAEGGVGTTSMSDAEKAIETEYQLRKNLDVAERLNERLTKAGDWMADKLDRIGRAIGNGNADELLKIVLEKPPTDLRPKSENAVGAWCEPGPHLGPSAPVADKRDVPIPICAACHGAFPGHQPGCPFGDLPE